MRSPEKALQKASNGKAHTLREAAKQLVGLGYLVIQTGKDGDPKRPLKKAWNREPAPIPAEIEAWGWSETSSAGIAVVPDGSVIGIDIDAPKSGGQEKEAEAIFLDLLDKFPVLNEAWVERTPSGGYHIIARVAPDVDLNKIRKSVKLANGVIIEVKSHRKAALVVAPTEINGVPYEVIKEPKAVGGLPTLDRDFFVYTGLCGIREQNKANKTKTFTLCNSVAEEGIERAFQLIQNAERGNRNNSVFKAFLIIGKLKSCIGDRYESVYQELYTLAKEKLVCKDFPETELRTAAAQGISYGEKHQYNIENEKFSLHPDFVASVIASELQDDLTYIENMGWYVWKGTHWAWAPKLLGVRGEVKKVMREKIALWKKKLKENNNNTEGLDKLEKLLSTTIWIRNVEDNMAADYDYGFRKSPKELPPVEEVRSYIPTPSGVFDASKRILLPHEKCKHLYLHGLLKVPYDIKEKSPLYREKYYEWFAGDRDLMDYGQWMLGSLLIGQNIAQKLFIFYGKESNGKSTLIQTIAYIMGDFATAVSSDLFKKRKKDNHPTGIMNLYGKRFAYVSDFADITEWDEEFVKIQTGDKIVARFIRENNVEFTPTHKTIIATNELPKIKSGHKALLRRIVPIPFRVNFEKVKKKTPDLLQKLMAEGSGILNWLIEGAIQYLEDPFREPPKSVGTLLDKYKMRDDIVASFANVCIVEKEGHSLSRKEVYEVFKEYCELNGLAPITDVAFTRRFREVKKTEEIVVSGERRYKNIGVRENWRNYDVGDMLEEIPAEDLDKYIIKLSTKEENPDPEPDGGGDGGSGGSGQSPQEAPSSEAPSSGKDFDTEYLDNPASLSKLKDLVNGAEVGFDLETTGLNPAHDKVRLLSIYLPNQNKAYVLDLFRIDRKAAWEVLMEAGLLVGHNIAFDLSFIMRDGIYIDNPKSRLWDTMIAEQILNYTKTDIGELDKYSLQHLANKVGIQLDKTLQKSDWSGLLSEEQIKYAAMDAYATYEIHKNQKQKLDNGLRRVFAIEMGALPAITMLRTFGVGVDKEKLNKTYEELLEKHKKVLEELNEIYTEELIKTGINDLSLFKGINWRSAEQVKAALIRLGFNEEDIKDTKKDTLLRYRDNPVVAKLLELRGYEKKITHADQCMKAYKSDGRLYANWKQIGADTGRMSCADPNPQQLPSSLRGCIVPKEGHVLIKADFSQIELRIAAAIANDQKMLKAFEEGTDLHKLTASLIKNKKADEVTKEERQLAKALNFGLIYGMREERLRNNAYAGYGVDITIDEAREYRKRFFETYVGLAKWHQKVETELRKHKSLVVTTLGGRKRLVNEVTAALNTPVQGTGADGLKAAAALYYKRLHEHGLIDKVRIVLMVHDEIVVEAPESLALKAAHLLTEAMVEGMQAIVKGVPIEVEAGIYADWGKTTHKIQEAWEVFCKLPKDSVVRDAILNDYEPDPRQAREDMSRYYHIKTILSGDDLIPF